MTEDRTTTKNEPDSVISTRSTPLPIRYENMSPKAPEGRFSLNELFSDAAGRAGSGPLELDIGFGRGHSLFERLENASSSRVIGIEIKHKQSYLAEQKRLNNGLHNLVVLAGDAKEILSRAQPLRDVSKVSVHFPDPWWKKRHKKRRVVDQRFLDILSPLLAQGAQLFVQTDVEDRAELYRQEIAEHADFDLHGKEAGPGGNGYIHANPFSARSNREIRATEDGLPIYRLLALRN